MENTIQEVKKQPISMTEYVLNMVVNYAAVGGEVLTEREKTSAINIITLTNRAIVTNSDGITWNDIDLRGCGFAEQVKHWCKLGITGEDKLYIDIRNNKYKAKKDIFIKPQYQTCEKLMTMYFAYPIVRFKTEVICIGDEIEIEEDFKTGLTTIISHKRNKDIDRNKYENIIGAYKIAFVSINPEKPLDLTQIYVEIDRNRIERAYNASSSKDKSVWNADSVKMVKKTVTWEMFNSEQIRPFMKYPEDVIKGGDLKILEESEEMDFNKETKYENVDKVGEEIDKKVATEDVIDVAYEDEN
jgi:hypothetical protein